MLLLWSRTFRMVNEEAATATPEQPTAEESARMARLEAADTVDAGVAERSKQLAEAAAERLAALQREADLAAKEEMAQQLKKEAELLQQEAEEFEQKRKREEAERLKSEKARADLEHQVAKELLEEAQAEQKRWDDLEKEQAEANPYVASAKAVIMLAEETLLSAQALDRQVASGQRRTPEMDGVAKKMRASADVAAKKAAAAQELFKEELRLSRVRMHDSFHEEDSSVGLKKQVESSQVEAHFLEHSLSEMATWEKERLVRQIVTLSRELDLAHSILDTQGTLLGHQLNHVMSLHHSVAEAAASDPGVVGAVGTSVQDMYDELDRDLKAIEDMVSQKRTRASEGE